MISGNLLSVFPFVPGAGRNGNRKCRIGYPGGCTIGKRPIDFHLMALRALGADVRENASGLDGECVRFEGQDIVFPKSSVGAAQQAILAAVLAKGVTHLYNCAKEPEVFWLCRYLKTMGALIEGEKTGEIIIKSGEFSETVHVYQSGEGVLLLTKSEYSVSDKGETIAVDLKSSYRKRYSCCSNS